MGLLKHAILPIFALLHLVGSCFYVAKDKIDAVVGGSWPNLDEDRTTIELHLLGALGAAHIALFVGCLVGIVPLLTLFYALDAVDAYRTGFPWEVLAGMAVLGVVGSVVHAKEPGVFTKDKKKRSKSS